MSTAKYAIGTIFVGCHLSARQSVLVKAVRVHICNLEAWVGVSAVSQRIEQDERTRGIRRLDISCSPLESTVVESDAHSLKLHYSYKSRQKKHSEWSLSERCALSAMFSDPLTLSDCFDIAGSLSIPVSIGVNSASPVTSLHVRLVESDEDRDASEGRWITVHADALAMRRKCKHETIHRHRMLFTFQDIGGLQGLSKWITRDVLFRTLIGELLSYWHVDKPYIGNRLVGLSIGAEMLYRKALPQAQKSVKISRTLKYLTKQCEQAFSSVVGNTERWVSEATQIRHNAAHGALRGNDERLYVFSESLYLLIVLNLLIEMQVPEHVLREVAEHRRWDNVRTGIA